MVLISVPRKGKSHYRDGIMSAMASQITGVSMVCSTICSGVDQRKHQSSASLAFVRVIHRSPVNSPHKGLVTRKMFPFHDVIMLLLLTNVSVVLQWILWIAVYYQAVNYKSMTNMSPCFSCLRLVCLYGNLQKFDDNISSAYDFTPAHHDTNWTSFITCIAQ